MENFARTSHYISELLFAHDCVIIPGFGGFVCSYAPAKVHPAQHVFSPPSKQVFFNKHLQNNDGLLINAIAAEVPCSFDEAQRDVQNFAQSIQSEIKSGRKVDLPHLGTLSADPEGNISFESAPDVNFLVESFGLSSFQTMPILRGETVEEKKEVIVKKLHDEKKIVVAEEKEVVGGVSRVWKVAAMIALPLVAASLLFTFNTNIRGAALAGLGINGGEPALYSPEVYFKKDTTAIDNGVKPDANGIYILSLDANSPGMTVSIYKVAPAAPDTTRVEVNISLNRPTVQPIDRSKYYVIGGAFGVPQNAENYRKTLIRKGYKPVILDNVRSQLTHIALASFSSKEEAVNFLSTIQSDINGAWILKQK